MKRFEGGMMVKVIAKDHLLKGRIGRVVRLRMSDDGAWVKMNEELPDDLQSFGSPDDPRHNQILLYPEECSRFREEKGG